MKNFIYDICTKVYFGSDGLDCLGKEVKRFGKKVLLCYGGGSIIKNGLYDKIVAILNSSGLEVFTLSGIEPNPRINSVREGVKICKTNGIEVLLAVGGGSTIDATKWIAAGALVEHDAWDFFSKWSPCDKALPIVSVLTLSATGSEMNAGGVISNPDTNEKIGRIAYPLRPKVSFLDPTNTFTVNKYQTACGSADIFSHLLEVYFAPNDTMFMLDTFIEGMLKTVIKYAPVAMATPDNYEARANLMWAGSWAINGFVGADKLHEWSCHPMEHELSAFYDITHGLGLAILTPRWLTYCLKDDNLDRYYRYGTEVFGIDKNLDKKSVALLSIEKTKEFLFNTLGLDDTFTKIGIDDKHFKIMAKKACEDSFINGFIKLDAADIENIFKACL